MSQHESSSYQSPISIEPFNHIHIDEWCKICGPRLRWSYNIVIFKVISCSN